MKHKIVMVISLLILLSACTPNETIKVGGLFALTGNWAYGGQTEVNFAQIAIDEINAEGGINGKQIEFILEDDKCSGKDAISGANKLIHQDNVKFILGPSCTPASGPVAPVANENQVFMMAATSTIQGFFDDYEFAYRNSPPGKEAAIILAKNTKIKKIAILTEQTEFSEAWSNYFIESFNGEIVLNEKFPTENNDFKSILMKIPKDTDGFFISTLNPKNAEMIFKQMQELGLKGKVLGNPTSIDTKIANIPQNATTIIPFSENKELLEKYINKFGKEPEFHFFLTASMYDSVYMLKDAIEYCDEDAICVKDYFKTIEWKGEVANWSFDKNGDPILPKENYRLVRIVNGGKVFSKI